MVRSQERPMLSRGLILIVFFLGCIYPFPAWGSPYQTADHYWPMHNITGRLLEDVQGAAETVVYNGAGLIAVNQLKSALSLDGKDDWVDTGGFNGDCVTEPSRCLKGFTISFWLRVHGSGYIMSSGAFTDGRSGPGFRLLYKNANHGFEFVLETTTKRWALHIQGDTNVWTHMAFTWKEGTGLKYYEDGNLSTQTNRYKYISRSRNYTPVITLGRPSNVFRVKEFGHFDISHLALWTNDLSANDVAGVYGSSVVYEDNSRICCYFKTVNTCFTDPCRDAERCRGDRNTCLCPQFQLQLKNCQEKIIGECKDQIVRCDLYTKQQGYCNQWRMRVKCPRSCSYCAQLSNETTTPNPTHPPTTTQELPTTTEKNSPSEAPSTPQETEAPEDDTTPTSAGCPPGSHDCSTTTAPTTKQRTTTRWHLPTGRSCEELDCPVYASCVMQRGVARCRCPSNCPLTPEMVCGDNQQTYVNKCVLKSESCRLDKLIKIARKGACGPGYKSAVHYWPLNHTTTQRTLLDIRGHKPGMTYNGVRMTFTDQLGATVSLDGRDEWIALTQINGTHVEDPGLCKNGLTVAFWLKFHGGEFIMSSGRFVDSDKGPGFHFVCQNCQKDKPKSGRRFVLELSTQTEVWRITLDRLPEVWLHLAFVWKRELGLKLYKNGRLWKTAEKSQSTGHTLPSDSTNSIILARPNSQYKLDNYGKFEIGHLVLWDSERSAYDVEVAFLTVVAKTLSSAICCFARSDDPCMKDACLDGCENFDEKHDCICPELENPRCDRKDECRDRIPECAKLAKRGECVDGKSYMRQQCQRTCQMCNDTTTPTVTAQAQNSTKKMSQTTLILIITAACLGFLALLVLAFYLGKYFSRKMNGEFVPGKIYHSSDESSNPDLLPAFVDPSVPRITDVPHKATRAQSSAKSSTGGQSSGGAAAKKQKKPMGVKITYKPPKWD